MPKFFSGEAANMSFYILNRSPTAALKDVTQKRLGVKQNLPLVILRFLELWLMFTDKRSWSVFLLELVRSLKAIDYIITPQRRLSLVGIWYLKKIKAGTGMTLIKNRFQTIEIGMRIYKRWLNNKMKEIRKKIWNKLKIQKEKKKWEKTEG